MLNRFMSSLAALLSLSLLAACSGTDYQPAAAQSQPIDLMEFAPAVDSFVVLLDTSGSMADDSSGTAKAQEAQNLVANFGAAVPDVNFNAGMVIFGKGASSTCMGEGVARQVYGMETFNSQEFQSALNSIGCVRSTTPIVDALDLTTEALLEDTGDTAVIIFSDFLWKDGQSVLETLNALKSDHEGALCIHTVQLGDDPGRADLIEAVNSVSDCGSAVSSDDVAGPAAMTAFAADVLMSPVAYEKHTLSAMALFDFDKSVLKEQGEVELQKLAAHIKSKGIKVNDIDIIGHTDSVGTQIYNAGLSERRAAAVEAYLVTQGVRPEIMETAGMGELDPVDSNDSERGRARNRRVEILVGAARPAGS